MYIFYLNLIMVLPLGSIRNLCMLANGYTLGIVKERAVPNILPLCFTPSLGTINARTCVCVGGWVGGWVGVCVCVGGCVCIGVCFILA